MMTDQPIVIRHLLEHREMLFAFVYALVRDHEAAEEIFQEVGVKVVTEAHAGVTPTDFPKWARGVARHCVADWLRKRQRDARVIEQAIIHGALGTQIEQAFEESQGEQEHLQRRLRHLKDCVTKLSSRTRELLALRYERRMAIEEVAAAMGWQGASVKVALSRARVALAECVKRSGGEG